MLELGDQGRALRLRWDRREPPGFFPGLLHQIEIQLEWGLRVQAKQLTFAEQMTVLSRSSIGIGEQAAQQGQSVAQGGASIVGFTSGPQQRRQLAARMQPPFDRQVE